MRPVRAMGTKVALTSFTPMYGKPSPRCSKEQIIDDFNDTLRSTRSISSISSTTSNGYRNPSQWHFFYRF
ncbi:unnamed protein product [Rotaria magnacalcarata]|uniref:Uncharacterized protein n=3 Tax=Rotaria magnacalcarata TaxID=392030 RepID=A0A8S2ULT5_9BILA|nr:unnamed protein product [Rotaria magnacalcarata]